MPPRPTPELELPANPFVALHGKTFAALRVTGDAARPGEQATHDLARAAPLRGESNHTGDTPRRYRRDAAIGLAARARLLGDRWIAETAG